MYIILAGIIIVIFIFAAYLVIKRKGDNKNVKKLIEQLQNKKKCHEAAKTLGQIGDEIAVEPLITALKDIESPLAIEAIRALAKIGSARAIAPVLKTLKDEDFIKQKCGDARGLIGQYKREAIEMLKEIGGDEAYQALGDIRRGDYGEETKKLLDEIYPEVEGVKETLSPEEILAKKGFYEISDLKFGLPSTFWWHQDKKMELLVTDIEGKYLVKGMKKYYIKSVSTSGLETWDRNLGAVMDMLKASFPEFHLYGCGITRVTPEMLHDIRDEIEAKETEYNSTAEKLESFRYASIDEAISAERWKKKEAEIRAKTYKEYGEKREVEDIREEVDSKYRIEELERAKRKEKKVKDETEEHLKKLQKEIEDRMELVKELEERGSATCYVIGFSTILKVGFDLEVLIDKAVEDIEVAHEHGGFTQSLERNLRIYHEEVNFPWLTHISEFVGMFHPTDISELGTRLRRQVDAFFILTAEEDINKAGEEIRGKRTPARLLKSFIDRVENAPDISGGELPQSGGWIGNLMHGKTVTDTPVFFPMDKLNHGYISGTTGSGKSYTARDLVENAIVSGANVLVFDTTRQWCGIVKPARGMILRRYDKLDVERNLARGFPASIYTPIGAGKDIPDDLEKLLGGCSVVSLRGLDDRERCVILADTLRMAYDSHPEESEKLKTLIVIEEAHSFLPENVASDAKDYAKESRNMIDRIAREMRKYGLNLLLISQSISDFKREGRIVREMMNSKFFMRATDRTELQYIEEYISKEAASEVKRLQSGEGVVFTPFFGPVKVCVRAPFTHVGELSDKEIEEAGDAYARKEQFFSVIRGGKSEETLEEKLIEAVNESKNNGDTLNMTNAQNLLRVSRKRIYKVVDKLERSGKIRTKKVRDQKGTPRIILPA